MKRVEVTTIRSPLMRLAAVAVLAGSLSACMGDYGTKETVGTLGGAALGGLLASELGGGKGWTAAGAVVGGLLGNQIGRGLDKADRLQMERAQFQSLERSPSGQPTRWYNPDSGNSGAFVPRPAFQAQNGQVCREYQQSLTIGGRQELGVGTACRQNDGSWRVVG
jgi:surface antigen